MIDYALVMETNIYTDTLCENIKGRPGSHFGMAMIKQIGFMNHRADRPRRLIRI